jgi:hypothetical protein
MNGIDGKLILLWNVIVLWLWNFLSPDAILIFGHIVIIFIAFLELLVPQCIITNEIMQIHTSNNDMFLCTS